MDKNRDKYIKVYLNENEEKEIEEAADKADRSVSNFARNKILNNLPEKVKA